MKKWSVLTGLSLLAAFLLFGSYSASAQPARDPEWRPRLLAGEFLNLTPEQKAKLEEFRKARREERKVFAEQMEKLHSELRELRKDPQANEKKINGLIDEIFKLRATQMKNAIKHGEEIKKIFTPEQLEKMKNFRERMMAWRGWRMGAFGRRGGWGPAWGPGGRVRPFWGRDRFPRPLWRWW